MARVVRFLRSAYDVRHRGVPLTRCNLRALWIQSDPLWRTKLPVIDMTDAEWNDFMEALGS